VAVIGGVALGKALLGDELGDRRASLLFGFVMRTVGERQEAQAVADFAERQAERVGSTAGEPADRPSRNAGKHNTGLPAGRAPRDRLHLVDRPHG
jgi:hypothetical protein